MHLIRASLSTQKLSPAPSSNSATDLVAQVRANAIYRRLTGAAKAHADAIVSFATAHPRANYYLEKLLLLLNTPDNPPAKTARARNSEIDSSVRSATADMKAPAGASFSERIKLLIERFRLSQGEERVACADGRVYDVLRNNGWNKTFLVDRRDAKNIVVKVKVRVDATDSMRERVHTLEDAIEKHISIAGLVVDLVFVEADGPDVFTVDADPTGWTTEGNWVGTGNALAHELGHLLGLDDEYDYIESHATNRDMAMERRLYWFTVEMKRRLPADGDLGIMSYHDNKPLDRHACEIARLDVDRCVTQRTGRPYAKFGPVIPRANAPEPPGPLLRSHSAMRVRLGR